MGPEMPALSPYVGQNIPLRSENEVAERDAQKNYSREGKTFSRNALKPSQKTRLKDYS